MLSYNYHTIIIVTSVSEDRRVLLKTLVRSQIQDIVKTGGTRDVGSRMI